MVKKDPVIALFERLHELEVWFADGLSRLVRGRREAEVRSWRERLNKIEREIEEFPQTPIAMVGPTGAGKSTLLNALLGAQVLPTSSIVACTAVITTVRFAPNKAYQAHVHFLTRAEWESELRASEFFRDTNGDEEETTGAGEWRSLPKATRDKLRAVYHAHEFSLRDRINFDSLSLPEEVLAYMQEGARPLILERDDPAAFRLLLTDFLSGEGRYWPLVKYVNIFGPFEALSGGAILIDLPGINDPNEAREEITRKYLRDAPFIWVVFSRGLTRDIRMLLLEQRLLQQLLLDGKVNALAFVGTHADSFNDSEVEGFGLAENFEIVDIVRKRNERVIENVRRDLDEIAIELAEQTETDGPMLLRLRQTLGRTRIFSVSAPAYMKIRGIGAHLRDYGIPEAADTGLPELLDYLKSACGDEGPWSHVVNLERKVDLLLEEVSHSLDARRRLLEDRRGEISKNLGQMRARLQGLRQVLNRELQRVRHHTEGSFRLRQRTFEERLKIAVGQAVRGVELQLADWSQLNGQTLKAIIARDGKFNSPSTGKRHNLNADIAQPVLEAIIFVWDDFFGNNLDTMLAELCEQLGSRNEIFMVRLEAEARASGGFDRATLDQIESDIEISRRNLRVQVDEVMKALKQTIDRVRRDLASSIVKTIEEMMMPAYARARQKTGRGVKDAMLDIIQAHARKSAAKMFDSIERELVEGVTELGVQFADQLDQLNRYVIEQANRVLTNLGYDEGDKETEDIEKELDEINAVLAKVKEFLP